MPTEVEFAALLQREDPAWILPAAPIVRAGHQRRWQRRAVAVAAIAALAVLAVALPVGPHRSRTTLQAANPTGATKLPAPDGTLLPIGQRPLMPAIIGPGLNGSSLSLSALRGEPVIVAAFGSWCVPCGTDAAHLESLFKQNRTENSGFLGVAVHDQLKAVKPFAARHREDFPTIVADPATSDALSSVGATGVPSLLLVDRDGRLAAKVDGPLDPTTLSRVTADLTGLRAETDDPTVVGLTLDGGALRVTPAPVGTTAGWGSAAEALDQAKEALPQFTSTGAAPIISPVTVQLARVTLTGRPTYTDRLSWVVSFRTDDSHTFYGCDLDISSTPQPVDNSVHQGYVVVIQDATTGGDGVTYTERPTAPQCGASYSPLTVAQRRVAVRWKALSRSGSGADSGLEDKVTIGWQAPPCATFDAAGGSGANSGTPFAVVVDEPLGPECPGSKTQSTTVEGLGLNDTVYPPGPLGLDGRRVP